MLKFFVRRPITTIMFVLFWVVLGFVSFPKMNIERTPSVDFPMVTATFVYPGAAPSEIESQVIKRAEDAISEVSELKKLTSQAFENGGFVMAEFNLGVDVNDKATEVKTKLDSLLSEFPADMEQPIVEKLNPLEESVVDIAVSGSNLRDLQEYVDDTLSNQITGIQGVASVSVFGGETRAIKIEMNPELLAARGATVMDVVSALGAHNMNIPGGKIEFGANSSNVRFMGEFSSVDEIANLQLTTIEGQRFKLSEIATVTDAARDLENGARYNGRDVIIASVVKSSDGNAINVSRALRDQLPELTAELKTAFPDAQMEIISDTSTSIADETYGTIEGIILGIIFTVLVLLAFTRNWRSTIIASVVIPASLVAGFFLMDASGFTINALTLLAYSSALGTLVSNAIILIESALQEMRRGKSPEDAAIDGTKKVAVSVLAGVGTNVVVFLPLAFMSGIARISQKRQTKKTQNAKTVRARVIADDKNTTESLPKSGLRRWFDYQHAHPWRVVIMAVAVLLGSAMLMQFVGNEFAPSTDANEINITARAPMGATYEKSSEIAQQIETRLKSFDDVTAVSVKIGDRGLQNIAIKLTLTDLDQRTKSDKEIAREIVPALSDIPDVEIQVRAGMAISSGATSADIVLNVMGADDEKRTAYANQILGMINQIPEVQSAVLAQQAPANETRFVPDQDKMNFWGINNSYAGATLRTALFGNDDYKYKENGEEYPIILEFAEPFKNMGMFENVFVNSQKGMVPLAELGSVQVVPATPDISRIDKNRITEIDVNIGKSTMGPVQKKIEAGLAKIDFEPGYGVEFGGMSEIQGETTTEIGSAFLLAVILTYMLLAAILNSLAHPFTIATSIITSFAGVFALMFLSGASMNVGAMLAFVMLVGLVVNNNILVLEPTIGRIANGEKPYDALWTELRDKQNMILMTSIAVMTGMVPQLWAADGMKVAMAAVMIGGMFASMVFTFVLTPALFFLVERGRMKLRRNKK